MSVERGDAQHCAGLPRWNRHGLSSLDVLASYQLVHELSVHRQDRKEVEGILIEGNRAALILRWTMR